MDRRLLVFAGASGLTAVAAGAFGAHVLSGRLEPRLLAAFETGVRYQMMHALAILALPGLSASLGGGRRGNGGEAREIDRAGLSFAVGIVLFSGSLYVLALTEWRPMGAITPLGGIAFLLGWIFLLKAVCKGGGPGSPGDTSP